MAVLNVVRVTYPLPSSLLALAPTFLSISPTPHGFPM
jgi:hypothetical protein